MQQYVPLFAGAFCKGICILYELALGWFSARDGFTDSAVVFQVAYEVTRAWEDGMYHLLLSISSTTQGADFHASGNAPYCLRTLNQINTLSLPGRFKNENASLALNKSQAKLLHQRNCKNTKKNILQSHSVRARTSSVLCFCDHHLVMNFQLRF